MQGLGLGAWGSGFRASGSGLAGRFRFIGLWVYRVLGLGFVGFGVLRRLIGLAHFIGLRAYRVYRFSALGA